MLVISPFAKTTRDFFRGSKNDEDPKLWVLTSSLVISWLFAKSITNAANLGMSFGIVGGVAYATYYLSFIVAGIIIYRMRVYGGFTSIHHFLATKFGKGALVIFSLLIGFRLMNEVWSNTMVIGSYFGVMGSASYYWAIVVFTLLTVAYTLKGGLRSSILTDLIQMALFGVLLFVILGIILPKDNISVAKILSSGEWTLAGGLNLLFVALIQIFSYPFHDPVMTDRGFITDPKTTLRSFIFAGIIGGICIVLFSIVGIYGHLENLQGEAPVEVAKLLGVGMMLMINLIMVTSAASTLDSTFNSFAKLWVVDLKMVKQITIKSGRIAIVAIMLIGSIPVFLEAEILSATTISGTMVLGLTPVFLFWKDGANKLSFYLSVTSCMLLGIMFAFGINFSSPFPGKYGDLLWVNLIGLVLCLLLYKLPYWIRGIKNE